MPELRGSPAKLLRCRHCGAPVSRDAATCEACGTVDPIAAGEAAQVHDAVATTDRDFNRARHDFELAVKTARSWQWKVEAYGIPAAVLSFGVLMVALAAPLGRWNPLLWFALSAGVPAAITFALFRLTAPSAEQRHRAFLLLREQAFKCTACGRPSMTVPSATGTVTCDYCGATLAAVPADEFVRVATQARTMAARAEDRRRDAEWQQWLRTMGDDSTDFVKFVSVATLLLLAASVFIASDGAFLRRKKEAQAPKVTALTSAADCHHCVPMAHPPAPSSAGSPLSVVRAGEGEEGLVVFAGGGTRGRIEECFAGTHASSVPDSQSIFMAAPFSTTSGLSADAAVQFFVDTYGARAKVEKGPGMPVGRSFSRVVKISGRSQDWTVHVAPCWFGVAVAALPTDSGVSWFLLLLPGAFAWGLVVVSRARGYF